MKEFKINIGKDFSKYIGGREKKISEFSGEAFREKFMDPNFENYDKIHIELDDTLGYPWDFLDEVFGSVAKQYGKDLFWKKINLVSRETYVIDKIKYIVDNA